MCRITQTDVQGLTNAGQRLNIKPQPTGHCLIAEYDNGRWAVRSICYNESRRCTLYARNRTRPQAAPPPPVRRSEPKAARRVGAPRPEAEPARARPQAGARDCAEPEEQGGASQPVTAAQEGSARGRRAPATLGITRRIEQNQHFGSGSTLLNTAGVCRGSGSKVRER